MDRAPVRVGVVGAGQWATEMHAPLHATAGPTALAGVWARDAAQGRKLAATHDADFYADFDELLLHVDAIDFAVPPAVQAALGVRAAEAGRALMLEKPLAADVEGAVRLVDAVRANGVPTLVALTRRYDERAIEFLGSLGGPYRDGVVAVSAAFAHGGLLPGGFIGTRERQGWRGSTGVLADLGPHLLDMVDAAAGPIHAVAAVEAPGEAVALTTVHESRALGQLLLSSRARTERSVFRVELFGHGGTRSYDGAALDVQGLRARMREEFAMAVRAGVSPAVDAARGLRIQRMLEAAGTSLVRGGVVVAVATAAPRETRAAGQA